MLPTIILKVRRLSVNGMTCTDELREMLSTLYKPFSLKCGIKCQNKIFMVNNIIMEGIRQNILKA